MKKKLEAELISIAHRVLKLKNKSELIQLHQEAQKLYEKLSVLRFVEENFNDVKPTIGLAEIKEKLENSFEEIIEETEKIELNADTTIISETIIEKVEAVEEPKTEEPISEISIETVAVISNEEPMFSEEIAQEELVEEKVGEVKAIAEEKSPKEEKTFKPSFELAFDREEQEKEIIQPVNTQIAFEDILGSHYIDPVFVKPEELEKEKQVVESMKTKKSSQFEIDSITINDKISKGFTVGLNDRIAFIKHLFANNTEDYNRVISQLMTFDSLEEVQDFINDMVKPDYNNWTGKEEYATRFMEVIEKRFS